MRKNIWLVLLLMPVCVLFMLTCDPELEEKAKVEADLILEGGRVAFYFDEPKLEMGKTYIVTFDMKACDESFLGNRMGGKLSYEETSFAPAVIPEDGQVSPPKATVKANEDMEAFFIVAGWDYCMPNIILDRPMKYKWTFTVGQQQRDNKPIFKDRNENIITNWQETPDGMKQFFLLIAQTPSWKNFPAFTQFGVQFNSKPGITIREKAMPSGTLTKLPDITLDNRNTTNGSGVIQTDFPRLRSTLADDPYTFIRVYMKGCSLNATQIEEREGVAAIGNLDNIRNSNPNAMVLVPAGGTKRPVGVAEDDFSEEIPTRGGSNLNFFVDLDIEDIMLFLKTNESYLNVDVTKSGRLDRIEMYTYKK